MTCVSLGEVAEVVRSKNAGPYLLGIDIIFSDVATYEYVKECNVLTSEAIAGLYGVRDSEDVIIREYKQANAVKVVMRRAIVAGAPGDSDVYGCQQHAPLLGIQIPVKRGWSK